MGSPSRAPNSPPLKNRSRNALSVPRNIVVPVFIACHLLFVGSCWLMLAVFSIFNGRASTLFTSATSAVCDHSSASRGCAELPQQSKQQQRHTANLHKRCGGIRNRGTYYSWSSSSLGALAYLDAGTLLSLGTQDCGGAYEARRGAQQRKKQRGRKQQHHFRMSTRHRCVGVLVCWSVACSQPGVFSKTSLPLLRRWRFIGACSENTRRTKDTSGTVRVFIPTTRQALRATPCGAVVERWAG